MILLFKLQLPMNIKDEIDLDSILKDLENSKQTEIKDFYNNLIIDIETDYRDEKNDMEEEIEIKKEKIDDLYNQISERDDIIQDQKKQIFNLEYENTQFLNNNQK